MKTVISFLARHPLKNFRVNYSPQYNTFIQHRILDDSQHPLCTQRKREHENRKREGLWWHVTSSLELSKSSVVRNWCRKRLRNAFTEALKERGFDERGKLVEPEALKKHLGSLGKWLKGRTDVSLTGSLRLHVQVPCIPAKYKDVKMESEMVLEALLEGMKTEAMQAHQEPARAKVLRSQWDALPKSRKSPPLTFRKHPATRKSPRLTNSALPWTSTSQTRQKAPSQRRADT